MNAHEFVFSEKKPTRILRHILFWICWWILLSFIFYTWWDTGTITGGGSTVVKNTVVQQTSQGRLIAFIFCQSFCFLVIHLIACYTFVSMILPAFLHTKKYFNFAAGIFLLLIFLAAAGYFIQAKVLVLIDAVFHMPSASKGLLWASIKYGLLNAPKIIGIAAIIKLVKFWRHKQKEKEQLEKEVVDAELELLKTQVHPHFLFNTLGNIYTFALRSSPETPGLLLRFSDILSYMLYECNDPLVPLNKEISMLKDYMTLEKARRGDLLEMNIQVTGDITQDQIAPLLLLHFIEYCFKQCNGLLVEQPWINADIRVENKMLVMKLMNSKSAQMPIGEDTDLAQLQRRLQVLYAGTHELKMNQEEEISMLYLKINMNELSTDVLPPEEPSKKLVTNSIKIYAAG